MTPWKDGNGFNPLRKFKLSSLDDRSLKDLRADMRNARAYHCKMAEAYGRATKELERETSLRLSTEDEVTDHAIVRYLERHGGMNVEAIRAKIRRLDGDIAPRNGEGRVLTVLPSQAIFNKP